MMEQHEHDTSSGDLLSGQISSGQISDRTAAFGNAATLSECFGLGRRWANRRGQAGMSILEIMIGVMLSTLMVLPVVGWTSLAMREQRAVVTRNLSGASLGNLRTVFTRDVANSTDVWVEGEHLDDCVSARAGARTILMVARGDRRTAYAVVPTSSGSVAAAKSEAARSVDERAAADRAKSKSEQGSKAEAANSEEQAKAAEEAKSESVPLSDEERAKQDEQAKANGQARSNEEMKTKQRAQAEAQAKADGQAKAEEAKAESVPLSDEERAKLDEQAKADQEMKAKEQAADEPAKAAEEAKADGANAAETNALVRVRCAKPGAVPAISSDLVDDVIIAGTDATCVSTAELAKRSESQNEALFKDESCRRATLRITTGVLQQVALSAVRRSGGSVADLDVNPIAIATAKPTAGPRKLTVAFDGSGSSDPLGEQLAYQWNFGDGSADTGPAPKHGYTATGTFMAILTVTTPSGRTSSSTVAITVADNAPVAVIAAPATGTSVFRGQKVTFSSAGSGDPLDAPYGGRIVAYAWDFGDGTTSTEANPTKAYSKFSPVGGYPVTLKVTDDAGQIATAMINVVVANRLPSVAVTASPTNGVAPLGVTFAATVIDEPDMTPAPPITWSWDLGNGTKLTSAAPVTTTYLTAGTYTAKLTVTDDSGATATATSTVTVTAPVGPAPPTNLRKTLSGKDKSLRFIDMSWDRRDTATNYEVRLTSVKSGQVTSGLGSGTTLRINGLPAASQDFNAQVRAMNSAGTWGDWSAAVKVTS